VAGVVEATASNFPALRCVAVCCGVLRCVAVCGWVMCSRQLRVSQCSVGMEVASGLYVCVKFVATRPTNT